MQAYPQFRAECADAPAARHSDQFFSVQNEMPSPLVYQAAMAFIETIRCSQSREQNYIAAQPTFRTTQTTQRPSTTAYALPLDILRGFAAANPIASSAKVQNQKIS